MKKNGWTDSHLFCTCCEQIVAHKHWDNGFMAMRCQCIKKAGHQEVVTPEWWIDKRCQGNQRAIMWEMLNARPNAYLD